MTRDQVYTEQLQQLGIYHQAFDPVISQLATMERELQRMVKAWKADGSEVDSAVYQAIERKRRDIMSLRDSLGLTPKALKRFRASFGEGQPVEDKPKTMLELIQEKKRASG